MNNYVFQYHFWGDNSPKSELIIAQNQFEALQIFKRKHGKRQLRYSNISNTKIIKL